MFSKEFLIIKIKMIKMFALDILLIVSSTTCLWSLSEYLAVFFGKMCHLWFLKIFVLDALFLNSKNGWCYLDDVLLGNQFLVFQKRSDLQSSLLHWRYEGDKSALSPGHIRLRPPYGRLIACVQSAVNRSHASSQRSFICGHIRISRAAGREKYYNHGNV